jgi:phenylacetate-coenzyme A ligase PaaK-like adenylate-forming protein
MFASPIEEVVRLHASSGTTGKPIVVAYTRQDLEVWTSVMVRAPAACGLTHGDIVHNAYGYGPTNRGLPPAANGYKRVRRYQSIWTSRSRLNRPSGKFPHIGIYACARAKVRLPFQNTTKVGCAGARQDGPQPAT